MYLGSFEDISHWLDHYLVILGFVRKVTNKPIIMCEFGYIGYGKPKTDEERKAVLQQYGFESEKEATKCHLGGNCLPASGRIFPSVRGAEGLCAAGGWRGAGVPAAA